MIWLWVAHGLASPPPVDPPAASDPDWVQALAASPDVSPEMLDAVRKIAAAPGSWLTTGRPGITRHPMTPDACRERRREAGAPARSPDAAYCGSEHMVRVHDASTVCIDQYEFPGLPCVYPVVWVRASEAAALCEAVGKRLCDAAEWEDACAGGPGPAEPLEGVEALAPAEAQRRLRAARNAAVERRWAYGDAYERGRCAAGSAKTPGCEASEPGRCGSNTYPTGAFPGCVSPRGVYDQHGNAAEHMSLPVRVEQIGRADGVTEMKGSWFIFDSFRAHPDHCRWRAPFWHGSSVRDPDSHRNYHLGFRCCADRGPR